MFTIGQKIHFLTVLKRVEVEDKRNSVWLFRCNCRKETVGVGNGVKRGMKKSCGCLKKENWKKTSTHGFIHKFKKGTSNPRFYAIWSGMRNRCQNQNNAAYKFYGKKGITVAGEWDKFENFYNEMWLEYQKQIAIHGEKNVSIDRIDNTKGYSKENCRWADKKTQARNKLSNHFLSFRNKQMTVAEFLETYGINKSKYYRRAKKGITLEGIMAELATTQLDGYVQG